ncbi:hypothetical protein MKK67_10825 [Methylobacterium sp. J-072]|uniref:hypothetical protein n=1 Tax=Methylobacterium sp. J-072 TaxID=2836651 RepID=UPI001FB9658A|nr:hypothetical protein [Methylobacterium sp. J-072]MCJ2092988.1 hypothetical protein [Methylobacterium sp. J-072]
MPIAIPIKSPRVAALRRLSRLDTARFLILIMQVQWYNRRMRAANRRVDRYGFDIAGADLALTMQCWLACHEAISTLLGCPEPPHVAQTRATLQKLKQADQSLIA